MPIFAAQHALFRVYDIRGDQHYFSAAFIHTLSDAFAQLYHAQNPVNTQHAGATAPTSNTVVVGFDVRHGSETIAKTLMQRLQQQGLSVIDLGLITTPIMAFWARHYEGHGIMVTASHSAKDTLGIKWLVANTSPSHSDIQQLYNSLATIKTPLPKLHALANPITTLSKNTVMTGYIDTIMQAFSAINDAHQTNNCHHTTKTKLNVTVIIDCMHGATSTLAQPLFTRFCQRVILLNNHPDGDFPTGNPDPTEPKRLTKLQQTVIKYQADMGLAFDGDGDRVMVVDNRGNMVNPDHLLYLLAQVALAERPKSMMTSTSKPQVLFDIKCSHHLPLLLTHLGATPVMTKTGSSLLRRQLQTEHKQALFAGELSGHFIFNDGYFIAYDDAMYAGLRLLHWWAMRREQFSLETLNDMTQKLPQLVSTADHYLPLPNNKNAHCNITEHLATLCHYLPQLLEADSTKPTQNTPSSQDCFTDWHYHTQLRQLLPKGTQLSCIDGLRLDFAHGFGVLRQSNTSHSLTVRFAGDNMADLKEIQARFVTLCRSFDTQLATQIAAINADDASVFS